MSALWVVNTDKLNLRDAPDTTGNILASLPCGQVVEVNDSDAGGQFWGLSTDVNGHFVEGFASSAYLRPIQSEGREALVQAAVYEWIRFNYGAGKESVSPYSGYVGEFWRALGRTETGTDTGVPWSAAYISYVVRRAGYDNFKYSSSHSTYIHAAVNARNSGEDSAPFWGYDLPEQRPEIGDMVCVWRTTPITYNTMPSGDFSSHCDIIVAVHDTEVRAVGGNVSDSVNMTNYALDSRGCIANAKSTFALLKNRF